MVALAGQPQLTLWIQKTATPCAAVFGQSIGLHLSPSRSFNGDEAVVAEGAPASEVGVEERSELAVSDVLTTLGLRSHDTLGGRGDSRAD